MSEQNMCYIATRPCGCVRLYMTEECAASKDGRKAISDALKRGYAVERVPHEKVSGMRSYCETCEPERVSRKQQAVLALGVEVENG